MSFGDRVAGLVSISSHTGEPGVGDPTPEALAALTAPPAPTIEAQIEADLAGYRIWSNPEWRNEEAERQYLEPATGGRGTPARRSASSRLRPAAAAGPERWARSTCPRWSSTAASTC